MKAEGWRSGGVACAVLILALVSGCGTIDRLAAWRVRMSQTQAMEQEATYEHLEEVEREAGSLR
jgi:hypothetical protein